MKGLKIGVAALAALLVLQSISPVFAWDPTFPTAPYDGNMIWWPWDSRINGEAYGIRWTQQAINAMKGEIEPRMDMTGDCRDGYPNDGDKLDYAVVHTDVPFIVGRAWDDCSGNPPIGNVEEEFDLHIDPWSLQADMPYYFWVEYAPQHTAVGGELNVSYEGNWPVCPAQRDPLAGGQDLAGLPGAARVQGDIERGWVYRRGPHDRGCAHGGPGHALR